MCWGDVVGVAFALQVSAETAQLEATVGGLAPGAAHTIAGMTRPIDTSRKSPVMQSKFSHRDRNFTRFLIHFMQKFRGDISNAAENIIIVNCSQFVCCYWQWWCFLLKRGILHRAVLHKSILGLGIGGWGFS